MADDEVQKFTTVHVVTATSGTAQPGETISLTREEYDGVKPYGSIQGEWKEKAAGKKPLVAE